jgi:hypothetical protein
MKKKFIVRLTEQDLVSLIRKQLTGDDSDVDDTNVDDGSGETDVDIKNAISSDGSSSKLDLKTDEGYKAYETIADKFISSRSSNLLGITGSMLADAAKNTFSKYGSYVPPELALAQLAMEGGFSSNADAKPIRTKNPFNVGNVDKGSTIEHSSVQDGIQSYYDLMGKNYLSGGKTASDLLSNFVNKSGNRYATNPNYESSLKQIAGQAQRMSEPVYASLGIKSDENIA